MKEETRTLILYRIERSRESLEEARILLEKGHPNTFVNRIYYACFYSVTLIFSFITSVHTQLNVKMFFLDALKASCWALLPHLYWRRFFSDFDRIEWLQIYKPSDV